MWLETGVIAFGTRSFFNAVFVTHTPKTDIHYTYEKMHYLLNSQTDHSSCFLCVLVRCSADCSYDILKGFMPCKHQALSRSKVKKISGISEDLIRRDCVHGNLSVIFFRIPALAHCATSTIGYGFI